MQESGSAHTTPSADHHTDLIHTQHTQIHRQTQTQTHPAQDLGEVSEGKLTFRCVWEVREADGFEARPAGPQWQGSLLEAHATVFTAHPIPCSFWGGEGAGGKGGKAATHPASHPPCGQPAHALHRQVKWGEAVGRALPDRTLGPRGLRGRRACLPPAPACPAAPPHPAPPPCPPPACGALAGSHQAALMQRDLRRRVG